MSTELEQLRQSYESSLSWRITKPLRAMRRRVQAPGSAASPTLTPGRYDSWLDHYHGPELARIDADCRSMEQFRDLDVDLWAMLLSQEYELYPNIRARLPLMPDHSLQELWNGASGERLANQSKTFYAKVCERYQEHTGEAIGPGSRVLDFGCGWGRLTRFFARDVAPGELHACDPVQAILDVCVQSRLAATLTRTPFVPEQLPYEEPFSLAYSFSVFTHISERAAGACIRALHRALRPGGLLVITVRPPEYVTYSELMRPALDALGADPAATLKESRYLFVPHPAEESHFQYEGGEMTYGDSVITLPYIRQEWGELFELLEADVLIGDLYQVMITLRRR